jgi:hypothetical protein
MLNRFKDLWRWIRRKPAILRRDTLRFPLFAIEMDNPTCHCKECGTNILTLQEDGKTGLCLYTNNLFGLLVAPCLGAKAKRFDSWQDLRPFVEHARDCHECVEVELDSDGDVATATGTMADLLGWRV